MKLQKEQIHFGIAYSIYQCVVACLLPAVFVGLLLTKRGRRRFSERFGAWGEIPSKIDWWIHAASLGEVQGVLSLIREIRQQDPDAVLLVTGVSPSGLDKVASEVNYVRLLPIDFFVFWKLLLRKLCIERVVITETELWPCLLNQVFDRGIPLHIINGRLSDYTILFYQRLRGLFAPLLQRVRSISVPDSVQASRFISLGVDSSVVTITGHTKYDSGECEASSFDRATLFGSAQQGVPILTLGSLRKGEEDIWFECLERLQKRGKRISVIVVPRHAERFDYFWDKITRFTERCQRLSALESKSCEVVDIDILLVDRMGVLRDMYAISDAAFIGATLVDIGGHNPFEAAMFGIPVAVGPYISVISEVIADMRDEQGVVEVQNADDIEEFLLDIVDRSPKLEAIGTAGKRVFDRYAGATQRVYGIITASEEKETSCAVF